jgi:Do/DeqQ family serine protease
MSDCKIRRLGFALLISGMAVASAQERPVGPSLAPLVERVAAAVVNISVTEIVEPGDPPLGGLGASPFFDDFQDQSPSERQGAGSGVIVDSTLGYVLTNHHVIADASEIQVNLTDNRSFDATVLGSDPESDVAVLKIDAEDLTAVDFASTDKLKVGDYVVAIGNPFGLGQTVTSGIVSALGRTSGAYFSGTDGYEDFIQTDAAINSGNSGGALINMDGDLVGINSAIISRTGGSVGIGFAIPAEMVDSVMQRLLNYGTVPRGLLGVYMVDVTPAFAMDYGLSVSSGALVTQIAPDSAAEAAGIRINDVIINLNGTAVRDSNQLRNRVAMNLPGQEVTIDLVRGGRPRTTLATLKEKPAAAATILPERRDTSARPPVFEDIDMMAETGRNPGLRVLSIGEDASRQARDAQAGLRSGDLITAVNQRRVRSVEEAVDLTEDLRNVVVEIERVVQGNTRSQLIRLR